ncbi:MAG TPA: hypothetical protein ENN45_05295 [Bacteroidetes bacterium]|nr:hypothetical protein [Bacteroidota bacterium]
MMHKKRLIILLVFTSAFFSCQKDTHPVPNVYVNIYINVTSTQYIELNNIGGWLYLTGGYNGIIVYRRSLNEFMAFDRACPHHPYNSPALDVDASGMLAECSDCGSSFLLYDGTVVQGPANLPLKAYRTIFDGIHLRIYN